MSNQEQYQREAQFLLVSEMHENSCCCQECRQGMVDRVATALQEAHKAGLEEAAKVAEKHTHKWIEVDDLNNGDTCERMNCVPDCQGVIAEAIRSLSKPTASGKGVENKLNEK